MTVDRGTPPDRRRGRGHDRRPGDRRGDRAGIGRRTPSSRPRRPSSIQPDGFTIDQEVPLTAIDQLGNPVSPIKVDPTSAHVHIPVFTDQSSKTVPVTPVITGTPAGGFEIASVIVDPADRDGRGQRRTAVGARQDRHRSRSR